MKISELENILKLYKDNYGDLDVYVDDKDVEQNYNHGLWNSSFHYMKNLEYDAESLIIRLEA